MNSDSQDSRGKHCRSLSDDDSPEDTKRHKHRPRHRHHRYRRHSSKKHNEDRMDEIKAESKEEVQEVRGITPSAADYDLEEGEIIEDKGVLVADADIPDKNADSDVESGEFKVDDTRAAADMMSTGTNNSVPAADNSWKCGKNLKSSGSDVSDGSKKHGSNYHYNEPPLLERIANGDTDNRSRKFESTSHTRCKSPSKGSSKQKVQHGSESKQQLELMEMDEDEYDERKSSSSRKVRENHHKSLSRSPSHSRYHMETSDRSKSASPDRMKERERSQSILYDERPRMRCLHERDEGLYENGQAHCQLDDERDSRRSTDYRFDSKDIAKNRKERSSSYHRSSMHESKDDDGDYRDRGREEKIYKDEKRMKEQGKRRERSERDNDHDRVLEKERDRGWGRDREREKESKRERGKVGEIKSDMEWDRKQDSERRRNKDRGRSSDRDLDRERRRDNSIATYRDRDVGREWDSKSRVRDRKLEMERGRDRNSARHRDKSRDVENDRDRRYHRYDDRNDGYGNRDRRPGYDETDYRMDRDRKYDSEKNRSTKDDSLNENADRVNRGNYDQKNYQERVDLELAEQEEDDSDRIKEQSRRLREAILQKYKAQQLQHEAMPQNAKASNEEPEKRPSKNVLTDAVQENVKKNVMTDAVQENVKIKTSGQDPSAVDTSFDLGKSPSRNNTTTVEKGTGAGGLGEGTPKSERSNDDMFCDDIFGDSPAGVRKMGKGDGLPVVRSGLHDNWDDPEGYYSFRFGEILDSRYEIAAAHGKGVFSTVVRAKDLKAGAGDPEEVAIKIIRNNETMLKAGTEELVILNKLVGADPDDRRHCVRYLSNFKFRNHLCIVFESLHMNLREVLKKFGRDIGLKLTAVRAYAKQLFIALKHLRNCGILHCDIKPDNMLVNDAKNVLKLCDFGNAMFAGRNEITPYLVSRFYRAPEIILGLPYDHHMDIWSVGCCLYELYTGKVLFPGSTNNDMLRLHMELKGPFPKKMLRKGAFIEQHFDLNLNFLAIEEDPVTKKPIRRPIVNIKPKDIGTIIKGSPGEDPKMLANFKELLDKIFALDPEKRQTVSQALNHPFITGK